MADGLAFLSSPWRKTPVLAGPRPEGKECSELLTPLQGRESLSALELRVQGVYMMPVSLYTGLEQAGVVP